MVTFLRHFSPSPDQLAMPDEPDAVLVARAQADQDAFAPLYTRYVEEIGRFCLLRLRDEEAARDTTQQIFARALIGLPRYQECGQFRAWLYTIARHVLSNDARGRRNILPLDAAIAAADPAPTPHEAAAAALDRQALLVALARLPEDQRLAIELRLAGLTGREVAAVMGRGHEAVKKLQLRALEKLRRELGELEASWEGRRGSG